MRTPVFLFILIQFSLSVKLPGQVATVNIQKGLTTIKHADLADITNQLVYIRLSDANQTALIGQISRIAANDSYIVIYDDLSHKLFLFDKDGLFLRILMVQGKGPYEFIGINSVDINNNNDILVLMNGDRIVILNADSNNKSQFEINGNSPAAKWLSDKKIVILYPFPYFVINQGFEISFLDTKGSVLNNALLKSVTGISYNNQVPRFNCARNGDSLYYWNTFMDTVYTITPDLKVLPRLFFNHSRSRYSIDELKKGAEVNGSFKSTQGYIQTSYFEFGELSLSGVSYKPKRYSLLINRIDGIVENILYDYTENHNRGFYNNLDGGIEFWPNYASFNGDLITYIDPDGLKEAFQKNQKAKIPVKYPAQQDSLQKNVIDKITLNDNPILIKLKRKLKPANTL